MNRRSDILRMAAMCVAIAFMATSAVFEVLGDTQHACVFVGSACVFLLLAVIIKLEWL